MMIFLRVASKNWFFTKKNVQRVTIVNYTYSPFYSPFIKLLFSNYSRWMERKTFIWLCLKVYQFCSTVPWPESLLDSVLWQNCELQMLHANCSFKKCNLTIGNSRNVWRWVSGMQIKILTVGQSLAQQTIECSHGLVQTTRP